jgi:hypothetical protein
MSGQRRSLLATGAHELSGIEFPNRSVHRGTESPLKMAQSTPRLLDDRYLCLIMVRQNSHAQLRDKLTYSRLAKTTGSIVEFLMGDNAEV